MQLTGKERVRQAIRHEAVDRLPIQIDDTGRQAARMAAHFGLSVAELPARLGNHLLRLDLTCPDRYNEDRSVKFDGGVLVLTLVKKAILSGSARSKEEQNLDAFPWPDPHAPGLLDDAARLVATAGSQYFLMPNFGWSLFERAWSLRGMVEFFMDMAGNPGYAGELLDRITAVQLRADPAFYCPGASMAATLATITAARSICRFRPQCGAS
jgi:uroporphyrinogen decarboxylase